MTCDILATGSKGNAVLLNHSILIDCGVPYKLLCKDPEYIGRLRLVFLTHAHGDHFNPSTIKRLHRERPSVRFACGPWMVSSLIEIGISARQIDFFEPEEWMEYRNGFKVKCVPIPHDVPNCAWDIEIDGETVFYATDCGSLEGVEAKNRDLYLVEGNYEEKELRDRIKDKTERGEFIYETRVENSHLSVEQAKAFLANNAGQKSRYLLVHKHEPSANRKQTQNF